MSRAGWLALLILGCGSSEPAPPAEPAPPPATTPTLAPPPPPDCAPFLARVRHVAAVDQGCSRDDQCACRTGLFFGDCGAPASRDTARRIGEIVAEASAEGCFAEGPRCAPRECRVACVEGRCVAP